MRGLGLRMEVRLERRKRRLERSDIKRNVLPDATLYNTLTTPTRRFAPLPAAYPERAPIYPGVIAWDTKNEGFNYDPAKDSRNNVGVVPDV